MKDKLLVHSYAYSLSLKNWFTTKSCGSKMVSLLILICIK